MNNVIFNSKIIIVFVLNLIILSLYSCSNNQSKNDKTQNISYKNSDSLSAERMYNKALRIYIKTGNPHFSKDSANLKLAVVLLDSSLQLVPDKRKYIHFKGDVLLRLGLIEEALEIFKHEYISFDSTKNDFSFYLGLLSYYSKEPDYKRYFRNSIRVCEKMLEEQTLDPFKKFNIESYYLYSLFFIDSVESIKQYVPFREKHINKTPFMFDFDLRTCSKEDLVGYFIFQDTFNGIPSDKKQH